MIKVENLTKEFKTVTAVENISFDIAEGEIFGFLGPNGAGKTTTIRMLTTLISPTSGTIMIDGKAPGKDPADIRSIIGLLTEIPGLYEKLSAYQNLYYFSSFYDIPDRKRKANIEKYMRLFDLWDRRDDLAGTYSKGMKQKLVLARALIHEPKILFLDEPTSALDPESAHLVRSFIKDVNKEGTTVFLCTHNLDEASSLSDRVCIIKRKIIRLATLSELQSDGKNKKVELVFAGDAQKYLGLLEDISEIEDISIKENIADMLVRDPERANPGIIKKLVDNGVEILYFNEVKASLEEIYLDLIKEDN